MTQVRKAIASFVFCCGFAFAHVGAPGVCLGQQTLFIVRHAERKDQSADSPLSPAGEARAKTLARMLRDAKVTAIYSSEFQRTIQTAQPLADQLHLEVKKEFKGDTDDFAKLLADRHPNGVILVVGHSNTVPDLLRSLKHTPSTPISISDMEFDNLFVVATVKDAPPTVARLRYGD